MKKQFNFKEWYQEWWNSHSNDEVTQTIYECMLDSFIKGREIGHQDYENEKEELVDLKNKIEQYLKK